MAIWAEKEKALPANKLMAGVVIAIAFASDKWWTDNPDATILAAGIPVAADAAGAVVGAVGAVIVNGSAVTAGGAGLSALYGAATFSAGVGAKLTSFFQKWFKLP